MSNRLSGWTYWDSQSFLDVYDGQVFYGEMINLGAWYPATDNVIVDWWSEGYFWIGGLNQYGIEDDQDIAEIWLETGSLYSFGVSGDYDYIDEGLSLEIFDNYGYVLISHHSQSNALVEDLILDFKPSYTGWHNLWVHTESSYPIYAELLIGVDVPDIAFIINRDDYNWDNDIDTGGGNVWGYDVISAEGAQLYRAYMGAMGRLPDIEGFNWWFYEIESGRKDLFTMADGFVNSQEFKGYADTNFDGVVQNFEFVNHMYEGVFGRKPDSDGYSFWMGELGSGVPQGDVLVYMTQSNEYVDQTLQTVADYLFI